MRSKIKVWRETESLGGRFFYEYEEDGITKGGSGLTFVALIDHLESIFGVENWKNRSLGESTNG